MKLTDITTSLELAKELKKVGYPQESLFCWVLIVQEKMWWEVQSLEYVKSWSSNPKYFVAPTAEELLKWLPEYTQIVRDDEKYYIQLDRPFLYGNVSKTSDKSLNNALAKMLIYLAKNKIIKFDK